MGSIEAVMASAINSHPARPAECAFYEVDPQSGATIEMFYADRERAQAFGSRGAGWYWRKCGCSPDVPSGPFIVCLDTHRDALARLDM
jgi:hypothetical protein